MNASHQKALRPKALVVALLAAPALSACGVNFGAQTDQFYTPGDGVNARESTVDVLHALIVSGEPGTGRLIAGLANNLDDQDDALVDVAGAGDDSGVEVSMAEVEIPAGNLVQLADTEEAVVVTGEEETVRAGSFVRVTFTFESADPVELNVPVLPPGEDYADVEIPGSGGTSPSAGPTDQAAPTDEPTDDATTGPEAEPTTGPTVGADPTDTPEG